MVEPGAVERTTLNLVQNALQAMDVGGTLTVELAAADDTVRLSIADDGCGMTPEVRAHAFEPFMSSKPVDPNGVAHASGLGLAVAKRLIEKNNGTISLESDPGAGTTVTVTLPALAVAGAAEGARDEAGPALDAGLCPVQAD
jgi:two-component system sensor histidine kinase HydH